MISYSKILRELYPDVPIVAGGIEASLRRFSHYDYWQDRLRPSIICDADIDMILYGMGEKSVIDLARRLSSGEKIGDITDLPQSVVLRPRRRNRRSNPCVGLPNGVSSRMPVCSCRDSEGGVGECKAGRKRGVPPLPASVVPPPEALSEPQHRPPSATRHIPRRRRPARHQEVVYRKRCA